MTTVTEGGSRTTAIDVTVGTEPLRVRAPGIAVRWSPPQEVPGVAAFEAAEDEEGWAEAAAANELELFGAVHAELSEEPIPGLEAAPPPILSEPGSRDAFVELRATAPPDSGLLAMSETDGVVQWFAPINVLAATVPELAGLGLAAEEGAGARELRFRLPASVIGGPALPGVAGGIGGSIVRFFRFKLLRELIDAPLTAVLSFLVEKVERKVKDVEGFRFFDQARDFPLATPAELQAMSGKRVLLLTHGIFSSLRGAFAAFAEPSNPLLQHLRTIYQDRIIGFDHWTVSRTPLETADALLSALPPNVQPDIVCHSRGGLVTRAMLEHPSLSLKRQSRFSSVGKAIFVAGANQGSPLASFRHVNKLLNIYAAVGSLPVLGAVGVHLKVVVGVLKVLAHGITKLPPIEALSSDPGNAFLRELNGELMTPTGEIVVVHANFDPAGSVLRQFLDLNVDLVFGEANDLVVPFTGAEVFDKWQQVGTNRSFGNPSTTQSVVMHTNFFFQGHVQELLRDELT